MRHEILWNSIMLFLRLYGQTIPQFFWPSLFHKVLEDVWTVESCCCLRRRHKTLIRGSLAIRLNREDLSLRVGLKKFRPFGEVFVLCSRRQSRLSELADVLCDIGINRLHENAWVDNALLLKAQRLIAHQRLYSLTGSFFNLPYDALDFLLFVKLKNLIVRHWPVIQSLFWTKRAHISHRVWPSTEICLLCISMRRLFYELKLGNPLYVVVISNPTRTVPVFLQTGLSFVAKHSVLANSVVLGVVLKVGLTRMRWPFHGQTALLLFGVIMTPSWRKLIEHLSLWGYEVFNSHLRLVGKNLRRVYRKIEVPPFPFS